MLHFDWKSVFDLIRGKRDCLWVTITRRFHWTGYKKPSPNPENIQSVNDQNENACLTLHQHEKHRHEVKGGIYEK